MIEVTYQRQVPYPRERVVSQFVDLEHIEHVHPRAFGSARLLSVHEKTVVWESVSPRYLGVRFRNVIHQEYRPPDRIHFRFVKGPHRGVEIRAHLRAVGEGTLVDEVFLVPLPAWKWLGLIVGAWIRWRWDTIWREDLDVGLCHGGWPGVPGQEGKGEFDFEPVTNPGK